MYFGVLLLSSVFATFQPTYDLSSTTESASKLVYFVHLQELAISDVYSTPSIDAHTAKFYQYITLVFDSDARIPTIVVNQDSLSVTYTLGLSLLSDVFSGDYFPCFSSKIISRYTLNTDNATLTLYFSQPVDLFKQVEGNTITIVALTKH